MHPLLFWYWEKPTFVAVIMKLTGQR